MKKAFFIVLVAVFLFPIYAVVTPVNAEPYIMVGAQDQGEGITHFKFVVRAAKTGKLIEEFAVAVSDPYPNDDPLTYLGASLDFDTITFKATDSLGNEKTKGKMNISVEYSLDGGTTYELQEVGEWRLKFDFGDFKQLVRTQAINYGGGGLSSPYFELDHDDDLETLR